MSKLKIILSWLPVSIISAILLWAYIEHLQLIVYLVTRKLYLRATVSSLIATWLWISALFSLAMIFLRGPGFASKGNADLEKHQSPPLPNDQDEDQVESALQDEDDMPLDRLASQLSPYVGLMSKTEERDIVAEAEGSMTVKANGQRRYCRKCSIPKPDRTHHCSTCNRCVLKMDHHCGVIGICIGHANYKAFLLFLIYTCLFCFFSTFSAGWALVDFVEYMPDGFELAPIGYAILMIMGCAIGLTLSGFAVFHLYLISRNKTTIENIETSRFRPSHVSDRGQSELTREQRRRLRRGAVAYHLYDLGLWKQNFSAVFKSSTTLGWILPIAPPSGDGRSFPVNEKHIEKLRRLNMEIRQSQDEDDSEEEDE